jgi:glutathione S-transferase
MIVIHGIPLSVHTRKAIITAHLKGIDIKVEPVIPFNPPPKWPELSPTGLIPVMQDGDFTLPDSAAICQYLERKRPTPAILPRGDRDLSRALWFEAYAGGTVFRNVVHGLFFQKVIRPGILKQPTDQAAIDQILATTQPKTFQYLESQANGSFLAGNALSVGDIAIVSTLINYRYLGFPFDEDRYPRLSTYMNRVVALPVFQRALSDELPFVEQMGLDRSFVDG